MKRNYTEVKNGNVTRNPVKVVLLGDGCIGKSTFFDKISKINDSDYRFPKKYQVTDNFDFTRLELKTSVGEVIVDLWDTAGQENRGGKLRDAYLKGADGVLLLYDVSEPKTASNIPKWLEQVKQTAPGVPVAVLGNKSDKFEDLQQSESVKLRECNLQRDLGHTKVKNFLISIKENSHLVFSNASFWSSKLNIKEEPGCLIGLEYVLTNIYGDDIKIES